MHIPTFARDIYDQIASVESWHDIKPTVTFKMEDASLPVNLAIPVCLFINEALTNIFRHAFPGGREGSIEVQATRHGDFMRIRIADDGVGIADDVDIEKPTSMGLKLMSGIADFQLRGKMEVERDQGTAVVLTFPMEPENGG
jgi:two-component sensor histidine kinase